MAERREFEFNVGGRRVPPILGIVIFVFILVALYFIARSIFWLLSILALPMLIATLIIDYRVVLGYIQWLVNLTKRNLIVGLLAILLSVLGYSLVSVFLLGKALFNRRIRQIEQEHREAKEGKLVDFEELESKPLDLDRLRERRKQPRPRDDDEKYDDFFEE